MPDSSNGRTDWFRVIVSGAAVTATLTFLGWVGMSVNHMADRLTRIEVTIEQNRSERIEHINDLRTRVTRLEDRMELSRQERENGGNEQ